MRPEHALALIFVAILLFGGCDAVKELPTKLEPTTTAQFESLLDGSTMEHFRGYHDEAIGQGWKVDDERQ